MLEDFKNIEQEEAPPEASAMINTFRAFGYNLKTAIADIIDNSISARAENIWIEYNWEGANSWVMITDDGSGMNKDELILAMTPGSKDPNEDREIHDLGRFGLGLKTSSFSQCKRLTVVSKKNGYSLLHRCWDLDYVNETRKWSLLDYVSDKKFIKGISDLNSGTTVVWEKLDRLVGNAHIENEAAMDVFLEDFTEVEEHLSLVFHRYLEQGKIKIFLNQNKLKPWDPFMKTSDGVQLIASEMLDDDQVNIKCYVLPHISKLSEEQRKYAKSDQWYELQGFYVYRQNRLLLHGDWLGLFSKNEHHKNARILIDIPNVLDHDWKIDIKKATATPSYIVKSDLNRLGRFTRSKAASIHRFRGNQILLDDSIKSFEFHPLWKARLSRSKARSYYVNPDHPYLKELLGKKSISSKELKSILNLIGESTPVESIIQYHSEEPENHELRNISKELEPSLIELARHVYKSLISSGRDKENCIKYIFKIEPFNMHPELIEYLN